MKIKTPRNSGTGRTSGMTTLARTLTATSLSLWILLGATPCLNAQSGRSGQTSATSPVLNLRVVALGHRRTAKFKRSEKEQIVEMEGPDGQIIRERIPAGVPIEIRGEPFEYLPSLVYVRERGLPNGREHVITPLSLNSASPMREISSRSRVDLLIQPPAEDAEDAKDQPAFRIYATAPVAEDQTHLLVALINRHTEKEGWREPIVRAFDVSPGKLPGGSLLLFNGTPFAMEIDIRMEDSIDTFTIEPMGTKRYAPHIDSRGRSLMRANLVARNGAKKQIYLNSVKVDRSGRTYLFAYFDPRKNTSNPAGLVQFSDQLPAPESF